jgi:hypothetical protein
MEAEAIAEVLGGRKVLRRVVKNADDLAHLVRKGLPADSQPAAIYRLENALFSPPRKTPSIVV